MNRKGFTLMELLMVIVIIALLSMVLIPNIVVLKKKNEEKAYASTKDNIISAAKLYVADYQYDLGFECGVPISIRLSELANAGYLPSSIINPKTKEDIDMETSVYVVYDCANKVFYYGYNSNYMNPNLDIPFNTGTKTGTVYRWGDDWSYNEIIDYEKLGSDYYISNDLSGVNPISQYFYLKNYVVNGKVENSYITFTITPEIASENSGTKAGTYNLIVGVDERNQEVQTVYLMNKEILNEAFGEKNCYTYNGWYLCELDNSELYAEVRFDGECSVFWGSAIGCYGDRIYTRCDDYSR